MNKETKNKIVSSLNQFMKSIKKQKAVIGLSGGIDSAVCLALTAEAIGKENVTALLLPEQGLTSRQSNDDANLLAEKMGIKTEKIPINPYLENSKDFPWKQTNLSEMNTKPRIRMMIIYNFANANDAIVIGTSNKSEIMLGYGTKYGDCASDILPIGDLYKTEVFELAKQLNIPESIINKAPSAELMQGQTDESELKITYENVDKILLEIEKGKSRQEIIGQGFDKEDIGNVFEKIKQSEHKRTLIPILKK